MEYNEVAAKWWADRLRNSGMENFNNGDESECGTRLRSFIELMLPISTVSEEEHRNIDKFEEILAETIKEHVEKNGRLILYVDYHPEMVLAEVARRANLDVDSVISWPWKTEMVIDRNKSVKVRLGAGAPEETIFSTKQ